MLTLLRIRNLALLADVEIEFAPGLNLLTGETGAGKSILVDALALAVGARASAEVVRRGAERASVEAEFRLQPGSLVPDLLAAAGLDPGGDPDGDRSCFALVIRRDVSADGSRAFVNGSPATIATLKRVGEEILEIHGQHRHQVLLQPRAHLGLLDAFAGNAAERERTRTAHAVLMAALARRQAAADTDGRLAERLENLRFRLAEIDGIAPQPGEEAELRRERSRLAHAVEIATLAEEARVLLADGGEGSLLAQAARLTGLLAQLAAFDPDLASAREELDEARIRLDDVAATLRGRGMGPEPDPARLAGMEDRLAAFAALARRHGSVDAALEFAEGARAEQAALAAAVADPLALEQAVEASAAEFAAAADALSRGRRRAARRLERAVESELAELAMAGSRFRVGLTRDEDPGSPVRLDGRPLRHAATGVDSVEFHVAPNAGEDLLPLARIASGGELSRLCLALESAIRARRGTAGCLVFDEVDAGIGGGVAAAVGEKLHRLGRERQVLCVTHLPQIASRADHHIRIAKRTESGRTVTAVAPLDADGRVDEVARMLGGARVTPTTRRHAEEMLGRAR